MSDYEPESILMDDNISLKHDISNKKSEQRIPFWSINPNIILDTNHVFEFFPTENMTYNQKLNAITRLVIVITIICFIFTRSVRVLFVFAITIFSIYLIYRHNAKNEITKEYLEGFGNPALDMFNAIDKPISNEVFDNPTTENPFSNVRLTDYTENPDKKPALPAAGSSDIITDNAKKMVMKMNPNQPDLAEKLFRDLGDKYVFEQSLRPFYSTANTIIPNDIQTFTDFCYGSMVSCKEGNMFACARDAARHINP